MKNNPDDIAPPPNTNRAIELLRQVKKIQEQNFASDNGFDKVETVATHNQNTVTPNQSLIGKFLHEDFPDEAFPSKAFPNEDGFDAPAFPPTLARFKIEKLIGEGGFAQVFLAHDPKLERKVALKVPRLGAIANVESRERFAREARSAGILSHPSIVPVFESGNVGPLSFIAYEFCEGDTLADRLNDQPGEMSFQAAAKIVQQLAHAVEHAHQRQIIHRDLKPANVLVETTTTGEIEGLKITDFGLAKNFEQDDSLQTTEGAIVGTPAYMSPEQASGGTGVGKPSDIYSLGVILYELLTGELPFQTNNRLKTLHAVVNDIPQSPSRLRKQLPVDLEAICLKCLEKEPAKRYESAFALASDLDRWSNGFSVIARRPSLTERTMAWCKRNPMVTAALVAVTVAFGAALYQWNQAVYQTELANRSTSIAERAASKAERNIRLSQQTIKSMVSDISTSSSVSPELGRKLLRKAIELQLVLIEETANEPEVIFDTALLHGMYARELSHTRDFVNALAESEKGIRLVEELKATGYSMTQDQTGKHSRLWLTKAHVLFQMNRVDEAQEVLNLVDGSMVNLSDLDRAHLMYKQAVALSQKKEWGQARLLLLHSMLVFKTANPQSEFSKILIQGGLVDVYFWLGHCENRQEQYRDAERTLIEGLQLLGSVIANTSPHDSMLLQRAKIHRELGRAQARMGKYDSARRNLKAAAIGFDKLFAKKLSSPSAGLFAFVTRQDLVLNEVESKNLLAARELALKLEDDFYQIPFDSFKLNEELSTTVRLKNANLKLASRFKEVGNDSFAEEHNKIAAVWNDFLDTKFPQYQENEKTHQSTVSNLP